MGRRNDVGSTPEARAIPDQVPKPNRLVVWGPGAVSVTDKVAERPPLADGVKVTPMVQLDPAVRVVEQVLEIL